MAFYGMKPDRAGIWGETHDEAPRADGFQTRFVRIGPAEKSDVVPPTIDEFTLVTHFHDGAEAYELRLRCKVLRGWTRGNRVGLALLAPDQYVDRNDPAWAAWCRLVPGIGAPGRYDPANPADSIVEDGRGRV
jgi:hypothetical protein